jgi:hypothetical protein
MLTTTKAAESAGLSSPATTRTVAEKLQSILAVACAACSLSASSAAPGVTFSVATSADGMGDRSVYAQNAAYFTTKGSAQVIIYRRTPYQQLGTICCQVKTEETAEYFLKSAGNVDLILQVARPRSGKGPAALSVYGLAGELISKATFNPATPFFLIALDRSRKYLALTDGSTITVLDSSLAAVRSQKLAVSLTKPTELLLSTGAIGALLVAQDSLLAADFVSGKASAVRSCSALGEQGYAAAPAEADANSYVVLSESGEGCRVDGVTGSPFKTKPRQELRGLYFTSDLLFVVTATSVEAVNTTSLSTLAVFELIPFYESKFGRHANEDPFFVQHEFDASASRLHLRGSVSTGTLFEISVQRSQR